MFRNDFDQGVLHAAMIHAACLATVLQDMLHEKLQRV